MENFDELLAKFQRVPNSIERLAAEFLYFAVTQSDYEFAKKMVDSGAEITYRDQHGKTCLHLAAQKSLRMVEILMENSTLEVLKLADKEGITPFIEACCHGNDAVISYFLNRGFDVNTVHGNRDSTPLFCAVSHDNKNLRLSTINLLLSAGANVNLADLLEQTPLLEAFDELRRGCFSASYTFSVLQDVCGLLIDRGSEVNLRYPLKHTPLHCAVIGKSELLVRKLLNAGSLIDTYDIFKNSPLDYACKYEQYKIATLLIDGGADLKPFRESKVLYSSEQHRPGSVVSYVNRKSKECRTLKDSCRLVIRKNLPIYIEKSALLLPLPSCLIKFIQLVD